MRSIHTLASSTLALAILLGACTDKLSPPLGHARPLAPARGGMLTVATFVSVNSIDPADTFDEAADPLQRLLFARLLRIGTSGNFEGDLAERFEQSSDGLTVRLHLRTNALFHDGTAVTTHDVKRSFERVLHPDTPCPAPSFYDRIEGYDEYRKGSAHELRGIEAESSHTVAFHLREPDAAFLALLTLPFAAPVCKSAGSRYEPSFSTRACGAGPFRIAEWRGTDALVLRRHDGYYDRSKPYLDGVTWLFGVPLTSQRFRFERGEIDLVHELSAADSVAFRRDPAWRPFGAWNRSRSTRAIFMNTELAPFDQLPVRQAVAHAIDREALASLRAGHIVAASSLVPEGVVGHAAGFDGQRFDLQAARELMREAGYAYDPATDTGGYPQTLDYLVPADSFDLQVGELFQQQLRRIGLRIRLKPLSVGAYLTITGRRGQARIGADGWSADFDDPSDFFEPLFSSRSIQTEHSQNRSFFRNAQLDQVLDAARKELDSNRRRELYLQAERIVRDQAPWAIAYGYRYYDVWQPYVHGYRPHPQLFMEVDGVWVDRDMRRLASRSRGAAPASLNALAFQLARSAP